MTKTLRLAAAQIDPIVGDLEGNAALMRQQRALAATCDLVVFGALTLSGGPLGDLARKPAFLDAVARMVATLAAETADGGPALLLGAPWRLDNAPRNAALLLDQGRVTAIRGKHSFVAADDAERRCFAPMALEAALTFHGIRLGVLIQDDMATPEGAVHLRQTGAEFLIALEATPFDRDAIGCGLARAQARVSETSLPLLSVHPVGGQDDLVFEGGSFALNGDSSIAARAPRFEAALLTTVWEQTSSGWRCATASPDAPSPPAPQESEEDSLYRAMMLGLRDYTDKNRLPGVVLGLSGGIDSALTAAVAVDALGPQRVQALMLPSPYTSQESCDDARAAADLLGIRLDTAPITPSMHAAAAALAPASGPLNGVAVENIQARIRGLLLMAMANQSGALLLTTGNKSESAVGYATLYGDTCGGYSVLKDLYKTDVVRLARWRNHWRSVVIPERVLTKAPTAELRPNQKDEESLPPYPVLDAILRCLVEQDLSLEETVARGHAEETTRQVWRMLDSAEYKRQQCPPGVRLSRHAFGSGRRYPLTNRFQP